MHIQFNPYESTITVPENEIVGAGTYKVDEFKQMCFENGWEGTLYKIIDAEQAFAQYAEKMFNEVVGQSEDNK